MADSKLEKRKKYLKDYYKNNRESIITSSKNYRKEHVDSISKYKQKYHKEHKTEAKKYKKDNQERIKIYQKEYSKKYYKKHKKSLIDKINKRNKQKYKTDSLYKLTQLIKSGVKNTLKIKNYIKKYKTCEILSCTYIDFKNHLESKFESWMTWDNHGLYNGELNYGWDIDHITPLSSAKTEDELLKLFHHTNLQPLCSYTNRNIKRNNTLLKYQIIKEENGR